MSESSPQDIAASNEWQPALQGYAIDAAALRMNEALEAQQADVRFAAQAEAMPNGGDWPALHTAVDRLSTQEAATHPSLEMYAAGSDPEISAKARGKQAVDEPLDIASIADNGVQELAPSPAASPPAEKQAVAPTPSKRTRFRDAAIEVAETTANDLDLIAVYRNQFGRRPLLKPEEEVELAQVYHEGERASARLANATLPSEERAELEQIAAAGKRAYDHLVEANLRLVYSIALRFRGFGVRFLDLVQEGNLGLMRAAELFDETQGIKFSVYATHWIRRNLINAVEERAAIHVPRQKSQARKKMHGLEEKHLEATGQPITIQALAKELDMDPAKVEALRTLSRVAFSLNQKHVTDEGDSVEFGDSFASTSDTADEALESERLHLRQLILREAFSIAFGGCRPETQEQYGRIIGLLFNPQTFEQSELTAKDLAQEFNLTRATISAIRLRFLNALQSEQVRELATKLIRAEGAGEQS